MVTAKGLVGEEEGGGGGGGGIELLVSVKGSQYKDRGGHCYGHAPLLYLFLGYDGGTVCWILKLLLEQIAFFKILSINNYNSCFQKS